jgi:type IV pilus assembly protein PilQ
MKMNRSLINILLIIGLSLLIGGIGTAQPLSSGPAQAEKEKTKQAETGYLENITFEKSKGKERVVLMLSRQSGASAGEQGDRTILVKVENLFIPRELRRAMGEGSLDNLIRVTPAQQLESGKPQALISMELNKRVPFSMRQDGHNLIIDFNVAALPAQTGTGEKAVPAQPQTVKAADVEQKPPAEQKPVLRPEIIAPSYNERLVTLEFQQARIKSVLQLLAEESGVNIVSGADVDDLKTTVTISLKKVPWEQALNTILEVTGLVRKQQGNIITVMTLKKMRDEEEAIKTSEKKRRDYEKEDKKYEQELRVQEGKRKQIVIEAKILEATDEFNRKLGVQWGAGFTDNLRVNKGLYPYGILAGANPIGNTPFGAMKGLAQGTALTPANLAANFPMAAGIPSFALGLSISSAYAVLDAEIAAAEKTSDVRILSSPKITTMDGEKAVIKQGEDVPIVTPATSQSPATVSFKEAVLKLEVKPTITPAGKIFMEVKATNDWADYARAALLQGNPPINKSEVDSKVVVNNGETLVVGGILKAYTSKAQSGLPWVSKIPILGWLFKYEDYTKRRNQLLIFITPKLVDETSAAGAEVKQKS